MKKKKELRTRLCVLWIVLSLLLTGCVNPKTRPDASESTGKPVSAYTESTQAATESSYASETTSASPETTEASGESDDSALVRWQNAGRRDFLPDAPVAMVSFSEMAYSRPDVESIYADFDALSARAKNEEDAEKLLADFYDLYNRYVSFYSMDSLANVLYSLDTTRSNYQDEYNYCEAEAPNMEEKLEALYKAFAASPSRAELESLYFTEGFFEKYDNYEVYTNPEYLRLSHEEAELLTEYRTLTSDMQVSYQDQTKTMDEWMESQDPTEYFGALLAYYDKYNPAIGDVYVRLIKVRQQLAAVLGYDSYAAYSYEMSYSRDYTPEEGAAFLEAIRTELLPVLKEAEKNKSLLRLDYDSASEQALRDMLRSAAENIGGEVWNAYRFMLAYDLFDIAKSTKKLEASFQTYLYDYEAPFVFLNAEGTGRDYSTFSHEFGHFTDSFHNYGADEDLETAETFSQAMEFLALCYTDELNDEQKERLLKMNLLDQLRTFVYQAAYADFEAKVYALDPDMLTVEKINETFLQSCKDFGINEPGFDFLYSQSWIDVLHFFEVPNYIISYCVSAESSLQVYRLEAEQKGAGVAAYFRLLDRDYGAGVQQVMEDANLKSPFQDGMLEQTAAFFRDKLLNKN